MTISRVGQIGLVPHAHNFWQRLIQWVTRSPVHHVVIGVGGGVCVSAELPVVRLRPVGWFPDAVWSQIDMTPVQASQVAKFALHQLGKPYSLLDDFLIGVTLILSKNWTPEWLWSRLQDDNQWQCAELADAALLAGGVNLFSSDRPACAVYPGSFVPYFVEHGWMR